MFAPSEALITFRRCTRELSSGSNHPGLFISLDRWSVWDAEDHANGSRAKFEAAQAESGKNDVANITGGAYDPTDIYNSNAYDL